MLLKMNKHILINSLAYRQHHIGSSAILSEVAAAGAFPSIARAAREFEALIQDG